MTNIDQLVSRIISAANKEPIDWDKIRGASISLDIDAQTKEQKAAVQTLKSARDARTISFAVSAIQRAFLQGKPGADGWPRRF